MLGFSLNADFLRHERNCTHWCSKKTGFCPLIVLMFRQVRFACRDFLASKLVHFVPLTINFLMDVHYSCNLRVAIMWFPWFLRLEEQYCWSCSIFSRTKYCKLLYSCLAKFTLLTLFLRVLTLLTFFSNSFARSSNTS